jgi:hypothetical protein
MPPAGPMAAPPRATNCSGANTPTTKAAAHAAAPTRLNIAHSNSYWSMMLSENRYPLFGIMLGGRPHP